MLARERRHVPGPSLNGGKGSFAGDVVHKDNALWGEGRGGGEAEGAPHRDPGAGSGSWMGRLTHMGAVEVRLSEGVKALLACSVPDLWRGQRLGMRGGGVCMSVAQT